MVEKLDLNALRNEMRNKKNAEAVLEKTRVQEIQESTDKIAHLEEITSGPTEREVFLAKSSDEQAAILAQLHEDHPETKASVPSVEEYVRFAFSRPDMAKIRLVAARNELAQLLNDSQE